MGQLLFFNVNDHFPEDETLAKWDVKSTMILSIDCTNVETFSMGFAYEIFILSETAMYLI